MARDENRYHYSTKHETLSLNLCGKTQIGENHVIKLTEEEHNELQKLLPTRPDLTQVVKLIDMKAAEEIARKHMANAKPVAASGPMASSGSISEGEKTPTAPKDIVVKLPEGTPMSLAQRLAARSEQVADAAKSAEIAKNPEVPPVLTDADLAKANDGGNNNNNS